MIRMPGTLTIEDLVSVLSLHPSRIRGAAIGSEATVAEIVFLGVLVPAGVVTHRLCDRCERQHFAEIVNSPDGQGWYCPADGFVVAEPADIAAYTVRVDAFVSLLAGFMDRQRRWAKPSAAPMLWSVGSFAVSGLQIATYFAVNTGTPDIFGEILPVLDSEPRVDGVAVLTNHSGDLSRLIFPQPGRIVPIWEYRARPRVAGASCSSRALAPSLEGRAPQYLRKACC
jgi:hypothetical protein